MTASAHLFLFREQPSQRGRDLNRIDDNEAGSGKFVEPIRRAGQVSCAPHAPGFSTRCLSAWSAASLTD